jgi:translation initiation factor IF-2
MTNGVMASVNQQLDFDTMSLVADHFGYEAAGEEVAMGGGVSGDLRAKHPLLDISTEDPATLKQRPPVVAVLGHVDHGKTSLLDKIKETRVAEGEAGGITQTISAYQAEHKGRRVTFIDTPGHAAFTEMRARGSDVADVAILVVAADDGVMPQTEEAIQHIRSAGVPIVVAMNKIDRDNANPDRVLQQLAERELVGSEYGGDTTIVRTSAKTGAGLDDLLEMVLLTSDLNPPMANPDRSAVGTVIESHLETGRGAIATVMVQNGTLKVGDHFVAGTVFGRVRALMDDHGRRIKEAPPSTPVVVTGMPDVMATGEILQVVPTERGARALAEQRQIDARKGMSGPKRRITLADLASQVAEGNMKSLNLVLKAEAGGSLEAVRGQLNAIEDATVRVKIVGDGVGAVGASDVNLAAVTDAIVIGFNVHPDPAAKAAAEEQGVDIRFYDVIYQITDDIEKAIKGMYEPTFIDVFTGRAEVRKVYTVDGKPAIAGSNVVDGRIPRNATAVVKRDGAEVARSKISALKRFKDDVREVLKGYDCGITLEDFAEFEEGDVIESYVVEQQNL